MTPTETADQEEQERREEEARREAAAEDELRLTAQEDVAVAREAEALVEAYPAADLDLLGHLQLVRALQRPKRSHHSPGSCAGSSPGWALPAPSGACQRRGHEKRAVEVAPPCSAAQYKRLDRALLAGDSMRKAAKKAGVGVATAHRRSQAPEVGGLRQTRNICRAAFWPWS